ncbi:hypothetical protein JAAARDRAFT_52982 [Jaapia argillacea MUCL 33604]|uniref:Sugar phosphate transporter domain-containing protein n=1 Tax=Jaapia argillacea MUCL 33604 TaxID=933084 RepID=A0A067QQW4_9AGAM|nr:hypothetical protein JAAARDRAFT_52982 [Jaapia argillacea MUCL 33604]
MTSTSGEIFRGLSLTLVSEWLANLTLIFGGCCSNALTLEQLTSKHPKSGSLITFAQFLLVSLYSLPRFITFSNPAGGGIPYPRLKPRHVPILPYIAQVSLFYVVSLLNNAAFGYKVPMNVHIIFRSGGLVVGMVFGWAIGGKRYTLTQVLSVVLVSIGITFTTLSASSSKPSLSKSSIPTSFSLASLSTDYAKGIAILSLALFISGFMGLVQDWTYTKYRVRSIQKETQDKKALNVANDKAAVAAEKHSNGNGKVAEKAKPKPSSQPEPWQESMFYLHFLALPMFFFVRNDIVSQTQILLKADRFSIDPNQLPSLSHWLPPYILSHPILSHPIITKINLNLNIPLILLLLTSSTSLLCSSGVHRLSMRVSSLTVTLILAVRKAVSLIISVVLFQKGKGGDLGMMWLGAALVGLGTVGYSIGSRGPKKVVPEQKKKA